MYEPPILPPWVKGLAGLLVVETRSPRPRCRELIGCTTDDDVGDGVTVLTPSSCPAINRLSLPTFWRLCRETASDRENGNEEAVTAGYDLLGKASTTKKVVRESIRTLVQSSILHCPTKRTKAHPTSRNPRDCQIEAPDTLVRQCHCNKQALASETMMAL